MGYYDMPIHEHPKKDTVRAKANHYVTGRDGGRDGGRDIDLRKFALEGMSLYGRLKDVQGSKLTFGDDLQHNLDQADQVAESIKTTIDKFIASNSIEAPVEARYSAVWQPVDRPLELDYQATGITGVIWSMGFGTDYRWIEIPIFDGKGYPSHQRGITSAPGIYFIGLPWQYTWGSGRFSGVAQDARYLANAIEARHTSIKTAATTILNMWALGS